MKVRYEMRTLLKKALLILLAVLMCLSTVACGTSTDDPSAETTGSTDSSAETEAETGYQLDLPADLNYNGEEIAIHCEKNSVDVIGDLNADVVSAAVYARNVNVETRLGVKIVTIEEEADNQMAEARRLITSGEDVIDILAGYQFYALPHAYDGLYNNLSEEVYLDWSKPWWADSYMDTIQWDENRYVLVGDISLQMLQNMSAFFVNKRLFEDAFGKIDNLYNTVFDGKWTYDVMNKYVADIYQDLNNNGKTDEGDVVGMRTHTATPTDHFAYSAGLTLSIREDDGSIILPEEQSRNVAVAEAMYHLFYENNGCYVSSTGDLNEYREHCMYSFTDGNTLFAPFLMTAADSFRDMVDPYAIITFPKLDALQDDYQTLVHDSTTVFAVPITVKDPEMQSAVLEALCYESYKLVTPEYFDVVLKSRYASDPSSARAIDMIRANIRTDFIYANNYIFGEANLGTIMRTLMGSKSSSYMSTYKRASSMVKRRLNKLNAGEH